jgi:hypothetical protein
MSFALSISTVRGALSPLSAQRIRTESLERSLRFPENAIFRPEKFRSFLPRADIQRICLFDSWLSSFQTGPDTLLCWGLFIWINLFDSDASKSCRAVFTVIGHHYS